MGKYIKEETIESYDQLIKIIQGKTKSYEDLREKFIFRGVEDDAYELIPSALRKNNRLNDFVDEDFKLTLALSHENAVECGFEIEENYYSDVEHFTVNKYGKLIDEEVKDFAGSWEEFQCVKELNTLMKFLSYADKVGLKVPIKQNVRQLLEHNFHNIFNHEESVWPDEDFYELISLAQHYGIPTRALDWSYDYRTALYFTVKNILNENYLSNKKPSNGILWAFNYKYFNRDYIHLNKMYLTKHYRPEYNSNPNLNAQKGLFTFIIRRVWENENESYDQHIEEFLDIFNQNERIMPKNEYAFYKFIIPENEKPNILKELYNEGYSEEYLFPGYKGVSETIKNRVKLDKLIKNQLK